MKKLVTILLLVTLVAVSVQAATTPTPKKVDLKGQMMCMLCDCVIPAMPGEKDTPHKCMAVFQSIKGDVYTLAPTEKSKELTDIKMHEQKVEIKGTVLPKSKVLVVESYSVIEKVTPKTPEKSDNWLTGYF